MNRSYKTRYSFAGAKVAKKWKIEWSVFLSLHLKFCKMIKQTLVASLLFVSAAVSGQIPVVTLPELDSASALTENTLVLTDKNEVLKHVGELVVIEGVVVQVSYAEKAGGKPIFLNMFDPYPNNLFSVIIYEDNLKKFLAKEEYLNKPVRITGMLRASQDVKRPPSINLKNPSQIRILE